MKGRQSAMGRSTGNQVVSYDSESRTLLLEASAEGLDTSQAVTLDSPASTPASAISRRPLPASAEARALDTDTRGRGPWCSSPGQTPQTSPDTADFTISSMGFDGQGRFHIRLAMAEGF